MVKIHRIAIHLTWRCTLRCEKCGAYIPEMYKKGKIFDYDFDIIKSSMEKFFELVDFVEVITLTGGEAILHKDIVKLCEFLLKYEKQFGRLDFQTNGTVLFSDALLNAMNKSDKFVFFIDHYGPEISTKVQQDTEKCDKFSVKYKVRKYYGEDAHMNGWIDWSPRTKKLGKEEAMHQFSLCANGKKERRPFVLYGNILALCVMPYCRYMIDEQPIEDVLNFDLLDKNTSDERKQKLIIEMRDTDYNPGCRYCSGLGVDPNAKRFKAGEQVKK